MSMDQDLKLRMAANTAAEAPEKPADHGIPTWDLPADALPDPEPAAEPVPNPPVPPAQLGDEIIDCLSCMERQLRQMNDRLWDMNETISKNRDMGKDLDLVYRKLDAVQDNLDNLWNKLSWLPKITERSDELLVQLQAMTELQEKTERMLTQALRENATFQQQVRRGMQHDLDQLREQLSGTAFNPILREIATMYSEYQLLLEDDQLSVRSRNNLLSLFSQMEDLLADYGAEVVVSKVGEVRPVNQCKITEKIPTGEEALHNTIARSRKPGVIRDRMVLYHELVDVYVYDPSVKPAEPAPEPVEAEAEAAQTEEPAQNIHSDIHTGGNPL